MVHRHCTAKSAAHWFLVCLFLLLLRLPSQDEACARQGKNLRPLTAADFQVSYDKRVPAGDARAIVKELESQYAVYQKKFAISFPRRPRVLIVTSASRLQAESGSTVYDDAAYSADRIVIAQQQMKREGFHGSISRVVAHALLASIPLCPSWLVETYAIEAGGDYARFGKPVQMTASSFADLGEDFTRLSEGGNPRSMYALLASTARFFADRYGEERFRAVFASFKRGASLEAAMEKAFGEKIGDIERAWTLSIRAQVKG